MQKRDATPLKNIRISRTISQAELAHLAGCDQQMISQAERGRRTLTPDLQARLASILGVARTDLFPTEAR